MKPKNGDLKFLFEKVSLGQSNLTAPASKGHLRGHISEEASLGRSSLTVPASAIC